MFYLFSLMYVEGIVKSILQVFAAIWWIVVPMGLAFLFWDVWLFYIRSRFKLNIKWVLLEIRIPQGVEKTPKSMEQIFASLMSAYSFGKKFMQKYWAGETEVWFSWELVGTAQGIHFYIRTPEGHRHLVESAIYSQYPTAEIFEAEDYIDEFGTTLPSKAYDLFGTEIVLARDDAYPIRTYPEFETEVEETRVDPLATLLEVMSRLKEGEKILIQLLIRPTGAATGNDWVKVGGELRDKLVQRKKPKTPGFADEVAAFAKNLAAVPLGTEPVWPGAQEEKKDDLRLLAMTPGERDIVEGVEKKIAKLGFESLIRFMFIDDRDHFTRAYISAIFGAFQQFNTHNLNSFRPNKTITGVNTGFFKNRRVYLRKRRLFDHYRFRRMPDKKVPILNVEELATVWHFPSIVVAAPGLQPVPTKKGGPPSDLPVE